jgi:hypothetical protein
MEHWQVLRLKAAGFWPEIAQGENYHNNNNLVVKKGEILPQQEPTWWFFSSWQLEVQSEIGLFSYQQ